MALSVFDIFKIGIGPSSSHTMGPMNAARQFVLDLRERSLLSDTHQVSIELFGSLALTGKGHCTDRAILLGLEGSAPESIEPDSIDEQLARIRQQHRINLLGEREIDFDEATHLLFKRNQVLPLHANGMRFSAHDAKGKLLYDEEIYSIGGGFILRSRQELRDQVEAEKKSLPYAFESAEELLALCRDHSMTIPELVMANERSWRKEAEVRAGVLNIWHVMQACVQRGLSVEGVLPGGLEVRRRALGLYRKLKSEQPGVLNALDWVNVYALAVNEENAAGGRVVTAPTNGGAGIVPAVLHFYHEFHESADEDGIVRFLLTAAAIGMLYKKNASISGAEMGCQGEVGVACSMAAGGLVAAQGGDHDQIEEAAEIGMEHNLGLTCDPVAGLVQIPCIERNTMGAVKAINAAQLALRGDGSHKVTLDQVIATMRQTGLDMQTKYKETSQGGLAVNVPEC